MFDKLVIAVAMRKLKHASEEISKRVEDIKAVFPKEKKHTLLQILFANVSPGCAMAFNRALLQLKHSY